MILSQTFRLLLSVILFQGLLVCLGQAHPLVQGRTALDSSWSASATEEPPQRSAALLPFSPPKNISINQVSEYFAQDKKGKAAERRKPSILTKRYFMPTYPYEDILDKYRLHKNISRVFNQSAQDVMRKSLDLEKRERWVHPGVEWLSLFTTSKGVLIISANLTYADQVEIYERVEKAAAFEKSAKEPGAASTAERPGKADKIWFDRNFDQMQAMPTPLGPLFVVLNATWDSKAALYHSLENVAIFQNEMPEQKEYWHDINDDGELLWRGTSRGPRKVPYKSRFRKIP